MVAPAAGEIVKGSREHIRLQKELRADKKILVQDQEELAEFSTLLREMETSDPTSKRYYWRLNSQVRKAMDREYQQTLSRAGGEGAEGVRTQSASASGLDEAVGDPGEVSLSAKRAERMKLIVMESNGLQSAMADGDKDARTRYHHLLAEFLGLMRAEADDMADAIAEVEAELP